MKQLNKTQAVTMLAGSALMVIGVMLYIFGVQTISPWIFAAGAAAFVSMQERQTYDGNNLVIRRLKRIATVGNICFLLAALLMIENSQHFLLPVFTGYFKNGYTLYLTYIYNNWVLVLLIAAIIQIYTTHRIANELKKEAKKYKSNTFKFK